jgi:hypothetical protein
MFRLILAFVLSLQCIHLHAKPIKQSTLQALPRICILMPHKTAMSASLPTY